MSEKKEAEKDPTFLLLSFMLEDMCKRNGWSIEKGLKEYELIQKEYKAVAPGYDSLPVENKRILTCLAIAKSNLEDDQRNTFKNTFNMVI